MSVRPWAGDYSQHARCKTLQTKDEDTVWHIPSGPPVLQRVPRKEEEETFGARRKKRHLGLQDT